MSVDISVSITEDVVDIIATPTVNIVNVTNSASIDPGLYDLSEFTNTSPNPFIRTSGLSSYVPTSRTITINGLTQDLSINRSWTIPATTWGTITGTLSAQTDLQTALNAKQNTLSLTTTGDNGASTLVGSTLNVPNYTLSGLGGVPTSRTLTINGVTQDLSANRTFTISTGITIGSTAIASGSVGRILFEGAGNVVQESSSLFWDEATTRFQVGTSSTSPFGSPLIFMGKDQNGETNFQISNATNGTAATVGFRVFAANNRSSFLGEFAQSHTGVTEFATNFVIEPNAPGLKHGFIISLPETTSGSDFMIYTGGRTASNRRLTLFNGTGNLAIGTTTDAGFRLDVNGTARVQNDLTLSTGLLNLNSTTRFQGNVINFFSHNRLSSSGTFGWDIRTVGTQNSFWRYNTSSGNTEFGSNSYGVEFYGANTLRTTMTSGGNWLINTTTDAGFRLDVNGTARVQGVLTIGTELYLGNNNTGFFKSTNDFNFYNLANGSVKYRITGASQGFGISDNGYDTVAASAMLQVNSTTKGFLPPRMTTTQKNAIASPAAGLMVYDTTLNVISYYNGTMWI